MTDGDLYSNLMFMNPTIGYVSKGKFISYIQKETN